MLVLLNLQWAEIGAQQKVLSISNKLQCQTQLFLELKTELWTLSGIQMRVQKTFWLVFFFLIGEYFFNLIFKRFYLFIFRERGREGEREEEKHQCVAASHVDPTGDLACNPGMGPEQELNQRPFGSKPMLNPLSYTSQGGEIFFFLQ